MICDCQLLGEKEFECLYVNEYGWELYFLYCQFFCMLVFINVFEVICFYVSFVCMFVFGEWKLFEGNIKIMCFIVCDEVLYCEGIECMICFMCIGCEGLLWKEIVVDEENVIYDIMKLVVE